jgi:hypothetical protein
MPGHHLPKSFDLVVQHGDERDLGGHDRGVGVLYRSVVVFRRFSEDIGLGWSYAAGGIWAGV